MNRCWPLLAVLLASASLPGLAQEVLRCEGADGKVGYANGTCPPGTATVRALPPAGTPNPDEQKAAQQRAQRDLRHAEALDRARRAEGERAMREQTQQLAQANKQDAHCRRLQTSLRYAQEDLAEARPHKRAEARRRVARAEDLIREDCRR
jgi:hypothetical protein